MPKNTWDEYSLSMHPRPFNKGKFQPEKPFMMITSLEELQLPRQVSGHTNHIFSPLDPVFMGRKVSIVID